MWKVNPEPFEIGVCTKDAKMPFSYWHDDEFPQQTYRYSIESEDLRNGSLEQIDPAKLTLVKPHSARRPLSFLRGHLRLGGRALRTLWENRKEIPERLWVPSEEALPYTKGKTSSFCIDGLRLLNPHGELCVFYFVRFGGEVRWGITPINYDRGPLFKSLVLRA